MNYYVIKPGADAHLWDEFRTEGIAKISYREMEIGDLRRYDSIQDVYAKAEEIKGYNKTHAEILFAFKEAETGGIIFAGKGTDEVVGVGVIAGPYVYVEDAPKTYRHQRSVRWLGEIDYRYDYYKINKTRLGRVNAFGSLRKFAFVTQDIARKNSELQQELLAAGVPIEDFGNEGTTKLTVEEWRQILTDQRLVRDKERKILTAFYHSPEHGDTCNVIAAKVKGIPIDEGRSIAVAGPMGKLGERIMNSLEREVHVCNREDDIPCYYNLLFSDEPNERGLQWTMRPNLVKAFSLLNTEPLPEVMAKKESKLEIIEHLNQILYGPPGTGKTYATIAMAVRIANPEFTNFGDREALHKEFRRLKEVRRIAFTTFHQSLSYEDFVEGLKPKLEDNNEEIVTYEIKPGVFRENCDAARRSVLAFRPSEDTKVVLAFDRKYELLAEEMNERVFQEEIVELESRSGGKVIVDAISDRGNFRIKHDTGKRVYTVGKERLTKLHLGLKEIKNLTNINDTFRDIIGGSNSSAYWAVLNAVRKYKPKESEKVPTGVPSKEAFATLGDKDYRQDGLPAHVLIIDEINRGNVSAILGELITLLEPDKRLGAREALTVTLPYSREEFGVPPNLYLIGTMNTADRSVEALDAALRRRFTFREVAPNPQVIRDVHETQGIIPINGMEEPVDLAHLLTLLNRRIKALKDGDHQIGHSYFLGVNDWEGLASAFNDRIIPLLREYFFANYGQLQLVVGKGFCAADTAGTIDFAEADEEVDDYAGDYKSYHFPAPATEAELATALHQLGLS